MDLHTSSTISGYPHCHFPSQPDIYLCGCMKEPAPQGTPPPPTITLSVSLPLSLTYSVGYMCFCSRHTVLLIS